MKVKENAKALYGLLFTTININLTVLSKFAELELIAFFFLDKNHAPDFLYIYNIPGEMQQSSFYVILLHTKIIKNN